MAITINGSGTITGLSAGGLPDGTVDEITTYTPTWVGVTNTANKAVWEWWRIGKLVTVAGVLKAASTTNDSTEVTFSLPVTPATAPTNSSSIRGVGAAAKSNVDTIDYGSLHAVAYSGDSDGHIFAQSDNVAWVHLPSSRIAVNDEISIVLTYHGA